MENKEQTDIIILVVTGSLGMLILVSFIILFVLYYQKKVLAQKNEMQLAENKFQSQLLNATIKVEEKERERIAKNIHDDIGTLLNVLKMNMGRLERSAKEGAAYEKSFAENIKLLDESIQGIRGIARDLVPSTLIKLGYVKAVNELCRQINNGQVIEMVFEDYPQELKLGTQTELQLYRITQELLNNLMKYSGANKAQLKIDTDGYLFRLWITHNGKGISNEQVAELLREEKGLGLKSLEGRARLIGAQIVYFVNENNRTGVRIDLKECPEHKLS